MDKRESTASAESVLSTITLHNNQTLAVSLPRNTRLIITEGAVRLTYAEPTLDWLGESAPLRSHLLHEGDTYLVEQSQYVSMTGASSSGTAVYIEVAAATHVVKRLYNWFARFSETGVAHADQRQTRGRHA
ncbi:hypothetical protein [Trinickia symbiotica]|nr:hypothetical protein [Trinickia symbiotica]